MRAWPVASQLTIVEFGSALELNPKYVGHVLSRRASVSGPFKAKVAEVYGDDIAELLVQDTADRPVVSHEALRNAARVFAAALVDQATQPAQQSA